MLGLPSLTAPPPHLYLSFKIMNLDLSGDFGPPFGPTVGSENNFVEDTTRGVGWGYFGGRCGTCGRLWREDRSSLFKTKHISALRYCATLEFSNEVKVCYHPTLKFPRCEEY